MSNKVMLGRAPAVDGGLSTIVKAKTVEERLSVLEAKIETILQNVTEHKEVVMERPTDLDINKDGIPFYTNLIGVTNGVPYVLMVLPDAYYVGNMPHASLSAAAKAVSGVRRSGWTFWKLQDGRTAKEAFKRP